MNTNQVITLLNSKVTLTEELIVSIQQLDQYQLTSLIQSLFGEYNVYITTGSPGSGKTKLLLIVKELCQLLGYAVLAVAPYGTAANQIGGLTLGSAFNKANHYLPRNVDGKYIKYKVGTANRKNIGKQEVERIQKLVGSNTTVKIIMDEFSSFTSEELVAFKDLIASALSGRKVSYLVYGQPLQTLAYDVSNSKQELNYANPPWAEAKFQISDSDIIKLPSFFTNQADWVVKSNILQGMHRSKNDVAYTNCLRMLEQDKKVELTPEWQPLYSRFTNIQPVNNNATYITTYAEVEQYNELALADKETQVYYGWLKYQGISGYVTDFSIKRQEIQINNKWHSVAKEVVNYLKDTNQHSYQELAVGLPYMSWINNTVLNIQNGTKGIITALNEDSIEVDGQVWYYVEANDVPTNNKGDKLFTYKALPGHLAVAMTSRKILGATINGEVVYKLPRHSESGTVYVCCSRVTKATDLTIYIPEATSLEEMIDKFNTCLSFNASAKAFWKQLVNNVSEELVITTPEPIVEDTTTTTTVKENEPMHIISVELEELSLEYAIKTTLLHHSNEYVIAEILLDNGTQFIVGFGDLSLIQATTYAVEYHVAEIPDTFKVMKQKAMFKLTNNKLELLYNKKYHNISYSTDCIKGLVNDALSTDKVKFAIKDNVITLYVTNLLDLNEYPVLSEIPKILKGLVAGKVNVSIVAATTAPISIAPPVTPQTTNTTPTPAILNKVEELKAQLAKVEQLLATANKTAAKWQSNWQAEKTRADKLEATNSDLQLTLVGRNNTIEVLKAELARVKEELAKPTISITSAAELTNEELLALVAERLNVPNEVKSAQLVAKEVEVVTETEVISSATEDDCPFYLTDPVNITPRPLNKIVIAKPETLTRVEVISTTDVIATATAKDNCPFDIDEPTTTHSTVETIYNCDYRTYFQSGEFVKATLNGVTLPKPVTKEDGYDFYINESINNAPLVILVQEQFYIDTLPIIEEQALIAETEGYKVIVYVYTPNDMFTVDYGQIEYEEHISRADLKANPNKLFIFGDNFAGKGFGGQAKEMRGEPNAVGIPTKRKPSTDKDAYLTDADYPQFKQEVDSCICILENHLSNEGTVVMPRAGIGTNLAKLEESSPKCWNYLCQELSKLGIKNGKKSVSKIEEVITPTYTFNYLGKSIETDFSLSQDQEEALKSLIDFSKNNSVTQITLQGAAGTGKTSIIGYLQKYLDEKFLYAAPTHAATVELAFATMKTGNKVLPITIASMLRQDKRTKKYTLSSKAQSKLGFGRIIVIDESSMINSLDYTHLQDLCLEGYKLIFLGDEKQIPEVKPGATTKVVTKAFTEGTAINLDVIHRTSNEDIKVILQSVRDSANFKLYKKESNTENVKFYSSKLEFLNQLGSVVINNPQNTDYIAYTNYAVSSANKVIREEIFGRKGLVQVGDIVMGYLGYSSKQIEKGHVANSVSYVVENVSRTNTGYALTLTSERLTQLREKGFKEVPSKSKTTLLPLSNNEVFENDFDEDVYNQNNQTIANLFSNLYSSLVQAQSTNKWSSYYAAADSVATFFASVDLMDTYIYNIHTKQMEVYDSKSLAHINLCKLYGSNKTKFIVEKGIDFGHAITIHKAQGRTTKNVFFDADTIPSNDLPIYKNGEQISTERQSLGYVGLSRASENLYVYEGWVKFTELE